VITVTSLRHPATVEQLRIASLDALRTGYPQRLCNASGRIWMVIQPLRGRRLDALYVAASGRTKMVTDLVGKVLTERAGLHGYPASAGVRQ
jgi:hypothetical protein